ncbi:MAG: tRNA pseudouridine(55) synthase TruB [Micrococcales bacterium]
MATPGLLLIDKDPDWTSHDAVAKARGLAGTRRVGHAGTLDPMATGLLILGIESATKLLTFLVGEDKTYEATVRLGATTVTDDREGDVLEQARPAAVSAISLEQIEAALANLRGQIMQVPSSVSAIKVDGKRAYAMVRGGDEVKLAARPVTVSRFEAVGEPRLVDGQFLDIHVVVDCSSGTYIRALARDLGAALGVGGHLTALRRTRIGRYTVDQAQRLSQLSRENLPILAAADAARQQFEVRNLSEQDEVDLRHGKRLKATDADAKSQPIAALNGSGELVAMLERSGGQLKSLVVFANA